MSRPPRLARFVAGWAVGADDRAAALADLDERYAALEDERGRSTARRWYWWQAVRGLAYRMTPHRSLFGPATWTGVWGDARQKVRGLARRPTYALGVLGTLAVGLSSAALVGSLAWNVWLSPMPFPDPDRVVRLFEVEPPDAEAGPMAEPTRWRLSPPLFEELRAAEWETVSAVAGVARNVADWQRDEELTRVSALAVSPEFFAIAGVSALRGGLLRDDPDAREVVLSEAFWRRAFGADPDVVGAESMTLGGEPHRIVGVVALPDAYPGAGDILTPLTWSEEQLTTGMRGARYLDVIARVRPDFDVAAAAREMARRVEVAGREHPNNRGWSGDAAILGDELLRPYRGILALLLAAGAAFLLLAVVNVAGLVTARAVDGSADRDVRLALGASGGRLLRESVVESALLSGGAALLALALARWLLPAVKSMVPADVPRVDQVSLGWETSLAVASAALLAGVAVGSVSHLLTRGRPGTAVRRDGASARTGGRNVVVAGQVALTMLLATAGAGILGTSLRLQRVDLGFEPEGVSSTQVMLTSERYPSVDARRVFWRDLLAELDGRSLGAAVGTSPPMAGVNMPWGYRVDPTDEQSFAQYHIVSPAYFSVLGIETLEGRTFGDGDDEQAAPVVVVNDAFAREHFPDGSAVGREIEIVAQRKTIVGVVEGSRHFGPDQDVPVEVYAPYAQDPWPHAQILVPGAPLLVGAPVAAAAEAVDPDLGLPPVAPYARFVSEWFAGLHLQLVVVGILGAVGTLLATLGLYALVAYRVSTRRREIGVRLALGASHRTVFGGVVRQGMTVTAAGIVAGLALWYLTEPLASGWLGDGPLAEPWMPGVVALLVGATCALATALPARGSVRVDPARTLREE